MKNKRLTIEDLQTIQKDIRNHIRKRIKSILRSKKSEKDKIEELLNLCNQREE